MDIQVHPRMSVPTDRIRLLRDVPPRGDGDLVLYWMIASRRLQHNFALDRALEMCRELSLPLVILEPLRIRYPHASARLHRFILDGMADNRRQASLAGIAYHPYVEPRPGAGKGLVRAFSEHAATIITDDVRWFHYPAMLSSAAAQVSCRLEAVDSDGLLPMEDPGKAFVRAHDFRRHLHQRLPFVVEDCPMAEPLKLRTGAGGVVPASIAARWPAASAALCAGDPESLARLPIDATVAPVPDRGGHAEARHRLDAFLDEDVDHYGAGNHPDRDRSSGLSPWLHFGHLGIHEVFAAITERYGWSLDAISMERAGRREGYWGLPAGPEAFLDQALTWREVGRNFCAYRDDMTSYDSLPAWALRTLAEHANDPRPYIYTFAQLDRAETHDEIWNAAQRQLRREGRMQNYLRMLWGKRILEWSSTPREACERMILLNDRYALDGRDPNAYSGIFWVLGRYDRAWGPERRIFGKIRYMSSGNTRRKLRLTRYLATYAAAAELEPGLDHP